MKFKINFIRYIVKNLPKFQKYYFKLYGLKKICGLKNNELLVNFWLNHKLS